MSHLLPCPFCGGEAVLEQLGTGRQSCIVACTECGARHESGDSGEHNGSSWNRRTLQAANAEHLVARLQAAPDLAVEVVGRLRVAGPWKPYAEVDRVRFDITTGKRVAFAQVFASSGRSCFYLHLNKPPTWTAEGTIEAAMAAADAALVAAGWALAGPKVQP